MSKIVAMITATTAALCVLPTLASAQATSDQYNEMAPGDIERGRVTPHFDERTSAPQTVVSKKPVSDRDWMGLFDR